MALINCPECGKAFSDKAVACPNCAYPLTDMDRIRLGVIDVRTALEKADMFYSEEKYELALEIYIAVAERNNSEASFKAGSMLCNGYGTDPNIEMGIKFLTKAADKDYRDALYFLGCYYDNNNVSEKAIEYFEKCCENIDSFNNRDKGHIFYRLGILLPLADFADKKQQYLETALKMGISKAESDLGKLHYTTGKALAENNPEEAVYKLKSAIKHGNKEAEALLGDCYYRLSKNSNDSEKKLLYLIKASKAGNQQAKSELGAYYLEEGLENNDTNDLENASALGNAQAMEKLGSHYNQQGTKYYNGDGVDKDFQKAEKFFVRATELGNETARKNLSVLYNHIGVYYYNGTEDTNPDYIKAEEYFSKARDLGNENAKNNLGIIYNQYGLKYQSGDNVTKNYETAEEFFLKAIDCGNEEAKENLIKAYVNCYFNYRHGLNGYIRDKVKANNYLKMARETDPEILQNLSDEYLNKARKMIDEGITHHNYKKINGYLKRAARLGSVNLNEELINFYKAVSKNYKKGNAGFTKDSKRANHYMRKAAELGDNEAIKKYKPAKHHSNILKTSFETLTGTKTETLKKAGKKGNYSYYYTEYDD